jgi:hypothetical protein
MHDQRKTDAALAFALLFGGDCSPLAATGKDAKGRVKCLIANHHLSLCLQFSAHPSPSLRHS